MRKRKKKSKRQKEKKLGSFEESYQ